ncbi:MAG: WYL domain-containing protein, partial [Muribaculaceae bacterium]|nr:WYL domain-containing protein [Muribaculaceae bacterium]
YTRVNTTQGVEIEPYFIRIYRQLWYVTGRNTADGKTKTYSLDRMKNLTIGTERFPLPPDADPEVYFQDAIGIMVTRGEPREVRLKATARQAKYLRALPLHASQREEVGDRHSLFTYRLLLTPELVSEIISRGPEITVISPPELKAMVKDQLTAALSNYD